MGAAATELMARIFGALQGGIYCRGTTATLGGSLANCSILANVYEMFYPAGHSCGRLSAISQVEDEARVAHCIASETGRSHSSVTQELLNPP